MKSYQLACKYAMNLQGEQVPKVATVFQKSVQISRICVIRVLIDTHLSKLNMPNIVLCFPIICRVANI